jgi:hypothetical protein
LKFVVERATHNLKENEYSADKEEKRRVILT